jgi:hypothetical protein
VRILHVHDPNKHRTLIFLNERNRDIVCMRSFAYKTYRSTAITCLYTKHKATGKTKGKKSHYWKAKGLLTTTQETATQETTTSWIKKSSTDAA